MAEVAPIFDQVLIELRRMMHSMEMRSKALEKLSGITLPQLLILRLLHAHGPQPIGRLATDSSLSQATATGIIDRLVSRGLVERKASAQDRRRVMVEISENGRAFIARAPSPFHDDFMHSFSNMESWEQTQFVSSLQRMNTMLTISEDRYKSHGPDPEPPSTLVG